MTQQINIPLLRKMVEWVEAEDALPKNVRTWLQGSWMVHEDLRVGLYDHTPHCGTSFCAAGFIAQLVDPRFAADEVARNAGWLINGREHASEVAQEALGLTDEQAETMWHAGNSAAMIRQLAEEFAGERL